MFPVEFPPIDENRLVETMESMRTWLDHAHFEPASFRCRFGLPGIVFRVEFRTEPEAAAFATAFKGRLVPAGNEMAV